MKDQALSFPLRRNHINPRNKTKFVLLLLFLKLLTMIGISGRNLMELKLQFLVWSHGGSVHALIGLF